MQKLFVVIAFFISSNLIAQNICSTNNNAFKDTELFTYKIYYNWGALWMAAGEASFGAQLQKINSNTVYHFTGIGSTYTRYDWFFKVRDKYESWADSTTLKPLRFSRHVLEGGSYYYDDYIFNHQKNKVYTSTKRGARNPKFDSIKINSCTNDVLTSIFKTRCLDFSKCKIGDSIPITFVLDGDVYPSFIRYLGKEIITDEHLGKIRCIKFSPYLIEGTIFKGGETMKVWVTDDENKMPVYVETAVLVGTVKVYLIKYEGLRNKLNCLIK